MDDMDIRNIFEQAKRGDRAAFETVYTTYYAPIYRYLYVRTRNKELSEDLAQDTFLKAYASIGSFTPTRSHPLAYLYTIARNTLIDSRRKRRVERVGDEFLESVPDTAPHAEAQAAASEEHAVLLEHLRRLSDEQQEVITMKFMAELSTAEIAEITGKRADALRQTLSRGLRALRRQIKTPIV